VRGTAADVAAALSVLPGPGAKRISFSEVSMSNHSQLVELAAWLPAAISAANVTDLDLPPGKWLSVSDPTVASLVLTLVGLHRLCLQQLSSPLLGHLYRALTTESPLTELALYGSSTIDAGLPDLAALIAHNQTRLRVLALVAYQLADSGCDDSPPCAIPVC
jgi:hypothetical protein